MKNFALINTLEKKCEIFLKEIFTFFKPLYIYNRNNATGCVNREVHSVSSNNNSNITFFSVRVSGVLYHRPDSLTNFYTTMIKITEQFYSIPLSFHTLGLKSREIIVLAFIYGYYRKNSKAASCTIKYISQTLHMDGRTVKRIISTLKEKGFLKVEEKKKRRNFYTVNLPVKETTLQSEDRVEDIIGKISK